MTNTEIGTRISERRIHLGLTMDDVAQKIGVAKSTIQRYEKGQIQKIKLPVIESIAAALSVNPDWIIGNTDDPTPKSITGAAVSSLSSRDNRDIAKDLESLLSRLDAGDDLMFDGDPMSDEARESIRAAMKLGLEAAKVKNKERFTPNKYKKG